MEELTTMSQKSDADRDKNDSRTQDQHFTLLIQISSYENQRT